LKQIGLAFLNHESTRKILPGPGWDCFYIGDPLWGSGRSQPGGWMYQILPYIEEQALYDLTGDGDKINITVPQKKAAVTLQQTPVGAFNCPSRRPAKAYAFGLPGQWIPINSGPITQVARGDYAANSGDTSTDATGQNSAVGGWQTAGQETPDDLTDDKYLTSTPKEWVGLDYKTGAPAPPATWPELKMQSGINFFGIDMKLKYITDGTSKTYMVGEKHLDPDIYDSDGNNGGGDNHSYFQGYDWDVNRWADKPPLQDTPGLNAFTRFGSVHPGAWHAVLCDGSVRSFSYNIDLNVHRHLANRSDGQTIPDSGL
jgi:hypothetical protein